MNSCAGLSPATNQDWTIRCKENSIKMSQTSGRSRGSVAGNLIRNGHGDVIPRRVIYQTYMLSSHWAERRESYFAVHPVKCAACGATEEIQLHHRSYEHFTAEEDDDLRALCTTCHQWVHQLERSSNHKLAEATDLIIAGSKTKGAQKSRNSQTKEFVKGRGASSMDVVFAKARETQRLRSRSEATPPTKRNPAPQPTKKKIVQNPIIPGTPGYPDGPATGPFRQGKRQITRRPSCKHIWTSWTRSGILTTLLERHCTRCGRIATRPN